MRNNTVLKFANLEPLGTAALQIEGINSQRFFHFLGGYLVIKWTTIE